MEIQGAKIRKDGGEGGRGQGIIIRKDKSTENKKRKMKNCSKKKKIKVVYKSQL